MSIDINRLRELAARDLQPVAQRAPRPRVPVVTETVRVIPIASAAYLAKDESTWTAEDLRDYVMGQIESWHGPQLRNPVKELAIVRAFIKRRGLEQAVKIARVAFEVERGVWNRAPISINRFCAASDPYFADKLAQNL